mmetsp:Transcript_6080/g.12512  ORF Transcript_6080/g.12512 Transcript_6080/m.12512 type:complete len:253 (+) Transcript_6080:465-1223(+)
MCRQIEALEDGLILVFVVGAVEAIQNGLSIGPILAHVGFQFFNRFGIPALQCCRLADGWRINKHVLLELVDGLNESLRNNHPSQPPSWHAIVFTKAVNDDNILVGIGVDRRILQRRRLLDISIGDSVVNFIAHENNLFAVAQFAQNFEFLWCQHRPGRIRGRGKNQALDGRLIRLLARFNLSFEFHRRDFVLVVDPHRGNRAPQRLQNVSITRISRRGNRYSVVWVETGRKGQQKGTRASRRHHDLRDIGDL